MRPFRLILEDLGGPGGRGLADVTHLETVGVWMVCALLSR